MDSMVFASLLEDDSAPPLSGGFGLGPCCFLYKKLAEITTIVFPLEQPVVILLLHEGANMQIAPPIVVVFAIFLLLLELFLLLFLLNIPRKCQFPIFKFLLPLVASISRFLFLRFGSYTWRHGNFQMESLLLLIVQIVQFYGARERRLCQRESILAKCKVCENIRQTDCLI